MASTMPMIELARGSKLDIVSQGLHEEYLNLKTYRRGESSGKQMIVMEYMIEPPTPCKVRNAISWFMLCAKPDPNEKAVKMNAPTRTTSLRPYTSARREERTAKPKYVKVYPNTIHREVWKLSNSIPTMTSQYVVV
jgi:hypothetical protein